MPKKSKFSLPPVAKKGESIGQRIARLRKERGYTQTELAERIGIIQALVSDYERDKLRLNAEMLIRFAQALAVASDEILGLKIPQSSARNPSLKVLRRLSRIESLTASQQKALLKTIDMFLKAAGQ
jgi:transcriptional regulator with XRE-family HTH domain